MKKERLIPRLTVKIALVFWAFSVHLDYCVRAFLNWCEWIFNGLNWCFFVMGGGFMAGTLVACHRNMLMVCPCAVVNCFLPFALRWWGCGVLLVGWGFFCNFGGW